MILKLIPGQRIHFTVNGTEEVQGNFGPQIKFTGATPDDTDAVMFLNVDAAQRQLSRIGLSLASVCGRTVEFARTEKNGTKYTDINLPANGAPPKAKVDQTPRAYSSGPHIPGIDGPYQETGAPPSGAHGGGERDRTQQWDHLFAAYDLCLDKAVKIAKQMDAAQIGSSPESVAAIAATLLIQADRQGLTR
jgi:hypothetical protein